VSAVESIPAVAASLISFIKVILYVSLLFGFTRKFFASTIVSSKSRHTTGSPA